MQFYRVKHIPTGLFYTPTKGSGNFSKKGKIYTRKPKVEDYRGRWNVPPQYRPNSPILKLIKKVLGEEKIVNVSWSYQYIEIPIEDIMLEVWDTSITTR